MTTQKERKFSFLLYLAGLAGHFIFHTHFHFSFCLFSPLDFPLFFVGEITKKKKVFKFNKYYLWSGFNLHFFSVLVSNSTFNFLVRLFVLFFYANFLVKYIIRKPDQYNKPTYIIILG
jgi:hypothetical protein